MGNPHGIAEYDPVQQKIHQIHIQPLLPTDSGRRQSVAAADERTTDDFVQPLLGDAHEIALQVELQDIGIARIVVRAAAYVVLDAPDPFARTFAFAARVAVEDHARLEKRRQVVEQEVMHYPVPELRSENFSFYRSVHDETYARRRFVFPVPDLLVQGDEVVFEVHLERHLLLGIALVFACIVIGPENIDQQVRSSIFHGFEVRFKQWQILGRSGPETRCRAGGCSVGSRHPS